MTTYPAWPAFAIEPAPLNDNLEQDLPDNIERSDFEQGMSRQRQLFRNAPTVFSQQWALTPDQFQIFKGFVAAVRGGLFTIPVFRDNDYQTVTAQFVKGSLKATRDGGEWIVACQLETMDPLALGENDYVVAALLQGYDGTLGDLLDQFHTAVQDGFFTSF